MQKDDATWLKLSYVVCALLSSFVMWKFFQTLGIQFNWLDKYSWYQSVRRSEFSCGRFVYVLLKSDKDRDDYLQAIAELRKVTWPSVAETKQKTIVVCVVVGVFAVILAVFGSCLDKSSWFITWLRFKYNYI